MYKKLFLLIPVLMFKIAFGQLDNSYFSGNKFYCSPKDDKAKEMFQLGMKTLQFKQYHGAGVKIFTDLITQDRSFCDAFFMDGYLLDYMGETKLAFPLLYAADSLAQNKSLEFKSKVATNAMKNNMPDMALKKFEEMKTYFPDNAEGYYGVALLSPIFEKYEYGLENINTAISKYTSKSDDSYFVKAILLTNLKRHQEAIELFENLGSRYRKDENFKIHYAFSLLKLSETSNDEKMKKKSSKTYNSIADKNLIPDNLKNEFKY